MLRVVVIVIMCSYFIYTWPRPRGSGLDLILRVLASFNITDYNMLHMTPEILNADDTASSCFGSLEELTFTTFGGLYVR